MIGEIIKVLISTSIVIVALLFYDFFKSREKEKSIDFGIKYMYKKLIKERLAWIIYIGVAIFAIFTGLVSWGFILISIYINNLFNKINHLLTFFR
ncbi:hypothetical protein ACXM1Z_09900 [Staphylococcus capitis]